MSHSLTVPEHRQTATKRIAAYCACVSVLFLAAVLFGFHRGFEVPKKIPADRQISAVGAGIQPKLAASYGKLPLGFEANQGQARGPVKFLSRGRGYTIFLTHGEAVLALRKSSVVSGQSPVGTRRSPRVAPSFRSAGAGLKSGATTSVDKPTTDNGPRATASVLRMKLVGANAKATVTGAEELPGKSNYFIGNDPKKWRTNVPTYAKVRYQDVYPGVDLAYYGTQGGQLEYDFIITPGADAHSIKLSFQGDLRIRVDKGTGDLLLALAGTELRFRKPVMYQPTSGSGLATDRHAIDGQFVLKGRNQIGFQVAAYDRRAPLIIDPVLLYSTFLGGGMFNFGIRVAVDASNCAYVTGTTDSSDFPTTAGEFSTTLRPGAVCSAYSLGFYKNFPCPDAFVTKLDPTGTHMVYSTYLGGSKADGATGISVDSSGNAYVTGITGSVDFPTTAGAFQITASAGRAHAFATKLNATGSALIYSTYLAGSGDEGSTNSALDPGGNLYVVGLTISPDFPTTRGAFQPALDAGSCIRRGTPKACADGFITKLNAQGSALVYSTYLGGSNDDVVLSLAVDSAGNAYATGVTLSTDFPTAAPLYPSAGTATCGPQKTPRPCVHAFVTKLNSAGTALAYSTYLAENGDVFGFGIAVDATGAAYVTGATDSSQFPTTVGAMQTSFGGGTCGNTSHSFDCPDAFVAKLDPTGSTLSYSTYLGGSGFDFGLGIAIDGAGNAYVVGGTNSLDFPTTDPTLGVLKGGSCSITAQVLTSPFAWSFDCPNAFLTKIDPTGSKQLFSTYLGGGSGDVAFGVAVDASGGTYLAGSTLSPTFPTVNAFQPSMTGYADGFISKFGSGTGQDFTLAAASGSPTSDTVAPGQSATYTLTMTGEGGFNQSVSLTCTGAPSEATCTVPNPVTAGSSATNVTVSVTTTAPSLSVPRSRPLPPAPPLSPGLRGLLMLALVLALMAWAIARRNQPAVSRWQSTMVPLASGLLLALALAGCGGGGSSSNVTHNPGTPAGTYTLTVTGSTGSGSATLSHSVTLTMTVD